MSAAVQAAMTARSGAKSWQNHSFPEEKRKEEKKQEESIKRKTWPLQVLLCYKR